MAEEIDKIDERIESAMSPLEEMQDSILEIKSKVDESLVSKLAPIEQKLQDVQQKSEAKLKSIEEVLGEVGRKTSQDLADLRRKTEGGFADLTSQSALKGNKLEATVRELQDVVAVILKKNVIRKNQEKQVEERSIKSLEEAVSTLRT